MDMVVSILYEEQTDSYIAAFPGRASKGFNKVVCLCISNQIIGQFVLRKKEFDSSWPHCFAQTNEQNKRSSSNHK